MASWRTTSSSALTTDVDVREALAVCALDPIASVLAAARLEAVLASGQRPAGRGYGGTALWGFRRDGRLVAICWAGANLVPVCPDRGEDAVDAFAEEAKRRGRRCSSIVGDAAVVLRMWRALEPSWGRPREVRPVQQSMVAEALPKVPADPEVRLAQPADLPLLLPACVAMFEEEVGYSPLQGNPGAYESRVRALVDEGRSFVRIGPVDHAGRAGVLFKAELGAVSSDVAQVQGVWVPPSHRGRGLSVGGMATVVARTLGQVAPRVSLYVNDHNLRARAAYARVGFREVGTYATVLF